ncbi:MAG: hydroxyacid dehydrogenase, partial [Acidobacteria bacterium]|nr:hydroxyacid dehydrogenase [Acidobacteriota bacterium]
MKVLVVDKFPDPAIQRMKQLGFEVAYQPELKGEALVEEVKRSEAEALVVRSTKVTEAMVEGSHLSLVIRAGSGYDTIDVAACSKRGIYVSNCPGKNSAAVAELALGLLLALDRRLADNVQQLREKQWNKKEFSKARGLMGRTLGILGVGTIGQLVIERAKAFGMRVVAWSRSLTPEKAAALGVERKDSPEEVAAVADAVSVHLALTPETRGRCGEKFFAAMKKGAYFINTSRGGVVDEEALKKAVQEKGIRAGLDVFAQEPVPATGTFEDSIAELEGVYGTHHIGASTDQAQEAIAEETVRILQEYRDTGHVPNVVNLCAQSPATHLLVVRHRDRVGVLAHVLNG